MRKSKIWDIVTIITLSINLFFMLNLFIGNYKNIIDTEKKVVSVFVMAVISILMIGIIINSIDHLKKNKTPLL